MSVGAGAQYMPGGHEQTASASQRPWRTQRGQNSSPMSSHVYDTRQPACSSSQRFSWSTTDESRRRSVPPSSRYVNLDARHTTDRELIFNRQAPDLQNILRFIIRLS